MAIEHARAVLLSKPWGVSDVSQWSTANHAGRKIGEIWYERPSAGAPGSALLFKLLFTSEPLSIQVHPDDGFAHAIGLARGKSEAWYVLTAAPGAKIALGLSRHVTPNQLREAVSDGSIVTLVAWRAVFPGDVIRVPAGTIHAIGAGLVIAEIQQQSDATFRLFDHGRGRELHVESAIAVADAGPVELQGPPEPLSNERTVLISDPHFVLEKIDLPPNSMWRADVETETWLLVLRGGAQMGQFSVTVGDAIFTEFDRIEIDTGLDGLVCLVAHTGVGAAPVLVRRFRSFDADEQVQQPELPLPVSVDQPGGTALYPPVRTVQ